MNAPPDTVEMPIQRGQVWRRAVVLTLLCAMLAALATSDALHMTLIEFLEAIESVIAKQPVLGAALFVAFAAISAMFAFVSVAAIVPVAVYTWGMPASMALLWLGWLLGGMCAYGISRWLGRPVVMWLTSNSSAFHRLESRVQSDTPFGLVLLFQIALPSEIPGYVLGLVRYSFPRYLLSLALAELPYTVATVYLGESFVERRSSMVLAVGLAVATLSVGAFYMLRKRLAVRR